MHKFADKVRQILDLMQELHMPDDIVLKFLNSSTKKRARLYNRTYDVGIIVYQDGSALLFSTYTSKSNIVDSYESLQEAEDAAEGLVEEYRQQEADITVGLDEREKILDDLFNKGDPLNKTEAQYRMLNDGKDDWEDEDDDEEELTPEELNPRIRRRPGKFIKKSKTKASEKVNKELEELAD